MTSQSVFGKVLTIILKRLGLNASMIFMYIDEKKIEIPATSIRNWKTGKSYPSEYNYDILRKIIYSITKERKGLNCELLGNDLKTVMPYHSQTIDAIIAKKEPFEEKILELLDIAYSERRKAVICTEMQRITSPIPVPTKIVVFDFDGTLTKSNTIKTTWESIWEILGYDVQECRNLHKRFDRHEIDHEKWCLITEEKFKDKKLHKRQLSQIIKQISLIDDIEEVFKRLNDEGIIICIVSGSIDFIIRNTLDRLCKYVHSIKANTFHFDSEGYLNHIIGTKYDFEGKARYIDELTKELNVEPRSVLFVGNSWNDEFVHRSGARTLCINPLQTSFHDIEKWHDTIENCSSLSEIYEFIYR